MDDVAWMPDARSQNRVDKRVGQGPTLRFAVAIFDTAAEVRAAVRELIAGGMSEKSFNCLGLRRVLSQAATGGAMSLRDLPFPSNANLTSATDGPVAACLAQRLGMGAETLMAALSHWLIPRHAALLQDAAAAGKIILWVQIFDNDEERRAYRSLLARSSNSVGVHDIVG
jgi:hypothetical protein